MRIGAECSLENHCQAVHVHRVEPAITKNSIMCVCFSVCFLGFTGGREEKSVCIYVCKMIRVFAGWFVDPLISCCCQLDEVGPLFCVTAVNG